MENYSSPDPSHFIFEINVRVRRFRHKFLSSEFERLQWILSRLPLKF